MDRAVVVALDTTLMENTVLSASIVDGMDTNWLIALGLGMWDHAQSYPDAHDDLVQWLCMRLPNYHNDLVCLRAAYYSVPYDVALRSLAESVAMVALEVVDCIEAQYAKILDGFIYEGGWTISGLSFFGNCVALKYDRTFIRDILSAEESLLSRLDQLYRPCEQYRRFANR